ncbi:S41 family peptidase [Evansella cellulosilytica]|uniref:Carboxyl-terminal protease n=1 Tax=Evansella cellulosilytica (strain ATCC 21833 / DSM 2522 / FERM P-1141 / JCM 9156 / N-4) TaxID=649639 RepID=E6TRJ2_EVAC2|nr:S41 family peptidase [Evansella cellulosilytica]ADU31822.1 carboxyl-terminal protease [Evansella cellulosilytica DSM 2522]
MEVKKSLIAVMIGLSLVLGSGITFAGMQIAEVRSSESVDSMDEEAVAVNGELEDGLKELEYIEKFSKAFDIILNSYYEEVEGNDLLEGAISGMLDSLGDPYSVYMDQETAQEFMESLDSSFEGIGAEVSMSDGRVTIMVPFRDSPAERAGLRTNDQILKVDGESVEGLALYDAVLKIRGEKGTTVTLTIERPGVSEPFDVDIIRDTIPIETVYSDIIEENGQTIGVIEITSFSQNTAVRFGEELSNLESQGIDGLIIDVRDNPGGLLQVVESIGSMVIPGGEPVLQIEDRAGEKGRRLSSLDETKPYPIVGLINEGSASASEILAAALNEAGNYELVGQTTFGKGTVQQTLDVGDGSEIKLTLFKWLTSAGNFINEEGVAPTIEVEQPEFFYVSPINTDEDLQLDMNNSHIATAQVILKGLGYDPQRSDGYFSKEMEEAVRQFQADMGIEVTGVIDSETADQLQQEVINAIQSREHDNQFKKAVEILTQ